MQAVQTYDESKGAFSTWAVVYIKLEMRKVLGITRRDQRADQGAASLNELLPGAEDITLLDTLEAADDTEGEYDHVELVQGVQSTVFTLPEPQRTLVQMHDLQGRQLAATGQRCGLSATDTYKTHNRALQTLAAIYGYAPWPKRTTLTRSQIGTGMLACRNIAAPGRAAQRPLLSGVKIMHRYDKPIPPPPEK